MQAVDHKTPAASEIRTDLHYLAHPLKYNMIYGPDGARQLVWNQSITWIMHLCNQRKHRGVWILINCSQNVNSGLNLQCSDQMSTTFCVGNPIPSLKLSSHATLFRFAPACVVCLYRRTKCSPSMIPCT